MKSVPPELEEKLTEAVVPAPVSPRMARFEEMKAVAAKRRAMEEPVKPPAGERYNPHNTTVLKYDLFSKPAPEPYKRTEKALPAGLRKDGEALDAIVMLTPELAFAAQAAKVRQEKKRVYANPTPVDAFGENPTTAKRLAPNGSKRDVELTQGISNGYKLSGKVDGKSAALSLRGATARAQGNLKNKFAFSEEELQKLDGIGSNWDHQISTGLKGRMKQLLDDAAKVKSDALQAEKANAPTEKPAAVFGVMVKDAVSFVHKKQKSFVDSVASVADGTIARGTAK